MSLVGFVAVSPQSLWIDEANTATKALAPDWEAFVSAMVTEKGSDQQMPLYMVLIWLWEKAVGSSEFALRALNIPLLALAIAWIIGRTRISLSVRLWFVVFACVSPMVWAYLDEARPYILQFFGGGLIMSSLVNLTNNPQGKPPKTHDALVAVGGALILYTASLLSALSLVFFGSAFLILWFRAEPLSVTLRRPMFLGAISLMMVVFVGCGIYYIWTLLLGSGASNIAQTNIHSVMFCIYEFMGFMGMGPGRAALRAGGASELMRHVPALFIYIVALSVWASACFPFAYRNAFLIIVRYKIIITTVIIIFMAFTVVGIVADFRILGRHLMFLLPFVLLGMAGLSAGAFRNASVLRQCGVTTLPAVMLISCLNIRFSVIHAKDDYRSSAVETSKYLANGKVVWWAADKAGAAYYSLSPVVFRESEVSSSGGKLYLVNARSTEYLESLPFPDLVVLSKVDIYDANGTLREFLQKRAFQIDQVFPAMTLWKPVSKQD
ncbi:MAG: hypothetical protein IAE94_01455 [Chthoniobacterales bacterium]|nr:hypothetical protein [Chthoniobacterales bacterium]